MTRRTVFILALFLLFAVVLAEPVSAGTEEKDNPSANPLHIVHYNDYHPNPPPPMGVWIPIVKAAEGGHGSCEMAGKWGNLVGNQGFIQYKQTGGTGCHWGGIHEILFFQQGARHEPGNWCVGSTVSTQIPHCVQLSDGSILLALGVNNSPIIQAEFITCNGGTQYNLSTDYCRHDFWAINF